MLVYKICLREVYADLDFRSVWNGRKSIFGGDDDLPHSKIVPLHWMRFSIPAVFEQKY